MKTVSEFRRAAWAVTKRVGRFIRNNPPVQAGLLALAGDMLVPFFHDAWGYGATALFLPGEAALMLFSRNKLLRRNPWMPVIGYTFFAAGMELMRHSVGVAHNPLLQLNLLAFSRLDMLWAPQFALKNIGMYIHQNGNHRLGRRIYRVGRIGVLAGGVGATLLHLPGIAGSTGLSGPFNAITFGGHSCWLAADYIMGGVKQVAKLAANGAKRVMHRPEPPTLKLG